MVVENIRREVARVLDRDRSGHGVDHVARVVDLALKFAKQEQADPEVVELIAWLHDVDDYKLFGSESAAKLTNARRIMQDCGIDEEAQARVCQEIEQIGYQKRLRGKRPRTIEGMVVSDADMCDASGANGILRLQAFSMAKRKRVFRS